MRRKFIFVITLIFTVLAAAMGTRLITPRYEAAATLRVATATSGSVDFIEYDLNYADRLMNTYLNLATTRPIVQQLAQRLDLSEPLGEVAELFELEIPANTELIRVTAQHPNPERAAAIANTLSAILIEENERVYTGEDRAYAYRVAVVESAIPPESPATPNLGLNLALGLLLGTAGGLGLAFLFENLDSTLRSVKQIEEATGLLALAHLSKEKKRQAGDNTPPQQEAFRRLRASILAQSPSPLRSVLVTGISSGEEVTRVVTNLALATSLARQRVVAVDANFGAPSVHTPLGLFNDHGLSDLLHGAGALEDVVQSSPYPDVYVLASGTRTDKPAPFGSASMDQLLETLKKQFCWVLLSAPSPVDAADALELASKVDGVVLVVRRQHAQRGAAQLVCRQLASVKAHLLGVVVTD